MSNCVVYSIKVTGYTNCVHSTHGKYSAISHSQCSRDHKVVSAEVAASYKTASYGAPEYRNRSHKTNRLQVYRALRNSTIKCCVLRGDLGASRRSSGTTDACMVVKLTEISEIEGTLHGINFEHTQWRHSRKRRNALSDSSNVRPKFEMFHLQRDRQTEYHAKSQSYCMLHTSARNGDGYTINQSINQSNFLTWPKQRTATLRTTKRKTLVGLSPQS